MLPAKRWEPTPRDSGAGDGAAGGSTTVAWLVAEIDLAIIERRLVAPEGCNALDLLVKLRSLDPRNETIRRLGGQVTDAIKAEAQARPDDPRLQAAVRTVTGPADAKPETEKVHDRLD